MTGFVMQDGCPYKELHADELEKCPVFKKDSAQSGCPFKVRLLPFPVLFFANRLASTVNSLSNPPLKYLRCP